MLFLHVTHLQNLIHNLAKYQNTSKHVEEMACTSGAPQKLIKGKDGNYKWKRWLSCRSCMWHLWHISHSYQKLPKKKENKSGVLIFACNMHTDPDLYPTTYKQKISKGTEVMVHTRLYLRKDRCHSDCCLFLNLLVRGIKTYELKQTNTDLNDKKLILWDWSWQEKMYF